MLFPTVQFAIFFVVVFTATWLIRPSVVAKSPLDQVRSVAWRAGMVAASLYFYSQAPRGSTFALLLVGSIAANWVLGEVVSRLLGPDGQRTSASKWAIRLGVVGNLAVLGWFKYYGFFAEDVVPAVGNIPGMGWVSLPLMEVFLPLGISFFTFQALSYVIDIGRGDSPPLHPLDFALYLSFFPHLVAGPIVRASEFAPQLRHRADPRAIEAAEAFRLIGRGLVKKVVISSYVANAIVEPAFAVPSQHSGWELLWAVYAYAVQIYADFSGYTDIAIGCALLLGFRFPQNFDAPYRSLSVQEFWRRWHMTLSRWLRDYLYIPLGGNRKGEQRTYLNLLATMLLGGLWHGANVTFLIWGAIHGGVLALERWLTSVWTPRGVNKTLVTVMRWFVTFHVVCFAWIFFRASDVDVAFEIIGRILAMAPAVSSFQLSWILPLVVIGAVAIQFVPEGRLDQVHDRASRVGLAWQALALGLLALFVSSFGSVADFIYFRF